LPFDLHVLGLPPAFTLSQDQTLHLKLHGPKSKLFECSRSTRAPITRLHLHAFESLLLLVRTSARWTTIHRPDARTSHLRTLSKIVGSGLSASFLPPRCFRRGEPHIVARLSHPSTPCGVETSASFRAPAGWPF